MSKKQKLELTWIGKEKRPKLEPRILLEDPEKSYHAKHRVTDNDIFDNRLIFGDNLLALKALEHEYAGKIKCVYIDPPFNTGQAFDLYDDGLEHSIWLDLMYQRLTVLHRLLSNDGLLWVHLDDSEVHYLKVMLDEIFGRDKFVSHISYERSAAAGIGQGGFFVDTSEHILCYRKEILGEHNVQNALPLELKTIRRYNKYLKKIGKKKLVREFLSKSNGEPVRVYEYEDFEIESISLRNYENRKSEVDKELMANFDTLFRTNQIQKENSFQRDLVSEMDKKKLYSVEYIPSRGKYKGKEIELFYYNAELFSWLKDTAEVSEGNIVKYSNLTNFWKHEDIPKADIANEGGVKFPRGKKPEQLLKRILEISTLPGDIVLDSFGGSGTTAATAHKLGRRWILIELGDHCHTHIIPRLKSVIGGDDQIGVSKATNWKGGGGFRYYRLAPSLLEKDKWGNWIVNPEYNAAMLAEALCKLEGFTYSPSETVWWQQGHSTETDFIYVTTQNLSADQFQALAEEVGEGRSLLVLCSAFRGVSAAKAAERWPNLTIKKIPKVVLSRCEWGHDDYSLNVQNLPMAEPEPSAEPKQKNQKKTAPGQAALFGEDEQ
ncbi:MAG: site-specific DNA-methyltransferase [Candidatus Thiodiazotropha endolucinida]